MLGRIYVQQGQKQKAKPWLERALDESVVSSDRLDPTARENRAAAKKALATCR